MVLWGLNAAATAQAADRCLRLGAHEGGARGLVVTRPAASLRAALERGSNDGHGKRLVDAGTVSCATTFWVDPTGPEHALAVVGPGWEGTVRSRSTRVGGLVAAADIAPTVLGGDVIRPGGHTDLERLRSRLERGRAVRSRVRYLLGAILLGLAFVAPRRAVVAGASAVGAAVLLSALGSTSILLWLPLTVAGAFAPLRALWIFFGGYLAVLALRPEWASLALLGPHPWGAGRFYGMSNEIETLLLGPALLLGLAAAPLVLVAVAWSRAGADGGGAIVFLAAYTVQSLGLSAKRLALACVIAVGGGLAFVGLDAATGGRSHVTRRVSDGPGAVAHELAHRASSSWDGATATPGRALLCLLCVWALAWIATRRPRHRVVDAFVVAIAVSLVANDTPQDVLLWGALQGIALRRAV